MQVIKNTEDRINELRLEIYEPIFKNQKQIRLWWTFLKYSLR